MMQSKNPHGRRAGGAGGRICENFHAIVVDLTDWRKWFVARVRCKMWSCVSCAEINKSKWRAHIIDGINKIGTFEKWWFVTVTAHRKAHKARSESATVANLQRGLKTLYDRFRRILAKRSEKMEYVRVYEHHLTKKVHAHMIIRATFTPASGEKDKKGNDKGMLRWLKDNCAEIGMGYQASAKVIEGRGQNHAGFVAAYVCKYMTKSAQGFGSFPKGLRRVQCSSGFGALDDRDSQYTWQMKSGIYLDDVIGRQVIDVNTGQLVTTDDFENSYVYPNELE